MSIVYEPEGGGGSESGDEYARRWTVEIIVILAYHFHNELNRTLHKIVDHVIRKIICKVAAYSSKSLAPDEIAYRNRETQQVRQNRIIIVVIIIVSFFKVI